MNSFFYIKYLTLARKIFYAVRWRPLMNRIKLHVYIIKVKYIYCGYLHLSLNRCSFASIGLIFIICSSFCRSFKSSFIFYSFFAISISMQSQHTLWYSTWPLTSLFKSLYLREYWSDCYDLLLVVWSFNSTLKCFVKYVKKECNKKENSVLILYL